MFTLNLVTCSLNRFPRIWRLIFHGKTLLDEQLLQGLSCVKKFTLKKFSLVGGDPDVAKKGERSCYFAKSSGFVSTPVYDGEKLLSGMIVKGPAMVLMHSTSTIIGPEQEAYVDEYRNVIIRQR